MDGRDEQRQAADALAMVQEHQDRTRRAARVPWWVYAAMFVLCAGVTAANDFVGLGVAKLIALLVLAALVATLVATFAAGSAPLSRLRGVQSRQSFNPRVFGVVVLVGGVAGWLISRYGAGFAHDAAGAIGLRDYPATVFGVLVGAVFTGLFALSRSLTGAAQRRRDP